MIKNVDDYFSSRFNNCSHLISQFFYMFHSIQLAFLQYCNRSKTQVCIPLQYSTCIVKVSVTVPGISRFLDPVFTWATGAEMSRFYIVILSDPADQPLSPI